MRYNLVGLTGYARSGKDTAAQVLINKGFNRVAFADPMKNMLYALNPIVVECSELRLREIVDRDGWEGAKRLSEVRELLQRVGTDAGRTILGDNIWIDTAMKKANPCGIKGCTCHPTVITDVRFTNEARAILAAGGTVIRVTRPGVQPANDHVSETQLDKSDLIAHTIINDGTVSQLHEKILSVVRGDH